MCGARYDEKKKKEKKNDNSYGGSYNPRYGYIPNYSDNSAPILEGRSRWIVTISFIFPIVGLIIWYVCKYTRPGRSASAADGALAGVSFSSPLVGAVLWYVWRFTRRDKAKMCGFAALLGLGFTVALLIINCVMFYGFGVGIPL